jgi:alkylation response protein AidB-like acyl-CoA dehydrogenase
VKAASGLDIGMSLVAPALKAWGTDEQRDRHLPHIEQHSEQWCQLFSEPGAGSDLASLSTRAVRDGDGWRVTGQKVWSTLAHVADRGILLARNIIGERILGLPREPRSGGPTP